MKSLFKLIGKQYHDDPMLRDFIDDICKPGNCKIHHKIDHMDVEFDYNSQGLLQKATVKYTGVPNKKFRCICRGQLRRFRCGVW